jgi:hypothetical protein
VKAVGDGVGATGVKVVGDGVEMVPLVGDGVEMVPICSSIQLAKAAGSVQTFRPTS